MSESAFGVEHGFEISKKRDHVAGAVLGAKIGGGVGAAAGAIGGGATFGPAGAVSGAVSGGMGGAVNGAVIGGVIGRKPKKKTAGIVTKSDPFEIAKGGFVGDALKATGSAAKVKAVLKPYSGANMKLANALKPYKGGVPKTSSTGALSNALKKA